MNKEQDYLTSLIEWGDKVKNTLKSKDFDAGTSSELVEQIEDWQTHIKNNMKRNHVPTIEEIDLLQTEGQRILSAIKSKTGVSGQADKQIPFGKHQLPPLPYSYNALEPYISEEIMRLHHAEHHQSYVDGLNEAESVIYKKKPDEKLMKHWMREQAFHGSGHNLHTIFWYNMTPDSSKRPSGEILESIKQDFGSWNSFKDLFTTVAASVEGDGWAVLLWNPRSRRLAVQSFEKHQLFQLADSIPLLVLDVWEHAYYLQYKTDKKDYITNWWNVVNWQNVNDRYNKAKKIKWPEY
ncbi:superoxide dismutase [Virgibacillus sp. C22-A2]|uniref:superoxide dismutase n=1 Tax=Virgibacillus tibetensis TaxID=3042313 RepID=A0ABU6KAI9_9BACI|nr:superoxide dismutase [Virgibacillus sp. C22-A2]